MVEAYPALLRAIAAYLRLSTFGIHHYLPTILAAVIPVAAVIIVGIMSRRLTRKLFSKREERDIINNARTHLYDAYIRLSQLFDSPKSITILPDVIDYDLWAHDYDDYKEYYDTIIASALSCVGQLSFSHNCVYKLTLEIKYALHGYYADSCAKYINKLKAMCTVDASFIDIKRYINDDKMCDISRGLVSRYNKYLCELSSHDRTDEEKSGIVLIIKWEDQYKDKVYSIVADVVEFLSKMASLTDNELKNSFEN
jgi:hypothetical protein